MPDKESYEKALKDFENGLRRNDVMAEYLHFSRFIQGCFISKDTDLFDTGSFKDVNLEVMYKIKENIEKYPDIWEKYFMLG